MRTSHDIVGVVLVGGQSRRMGTDKALLPMHKNDNTTMLTYSTRLLGSLLSSVWISCRKEQYTQGLFTSEAQHTETPYKSTFIYDIYENCGPCGAIYTALHHAKVQGFTAILTLACDMPFMNTSTLQKLLTTRAQRQISCSDNTMLTTFFNQETRRMQTLAAIYEVTALPFFAKALQDKQYKVQRIIPEKQRLLIPYDETEEHIFFNCNSPDDLKKCIYRGRGTLTD